jgi:hypothetical protein
MRPARHADVNGFPPWWCCGSQQVKPRHDRKQNDTKGYSDNAKLPTLTHATNLSLANQSHNSHSHQLTSPTQLGWDLELPRPLSNCFIRPTPLLSQAETHIKAYERTEHFSKIPDRSKS